MSLTEVGFERPRLAEIKADLDQRFIDALGPVNTEPDAVVGQIIGILAAALDDVWEAVQATYDSMYPSTAEGTSLDGAVSFIGLERLDTTPTSVVAMCYGSEGTLVPVGALARSLSGDQYIVTSDTVIGRSSSGDVTIQVSTVTNGAVYQIIAGGVSETYTADGSATAEEIAAGLAAAFDPQNYIAEADGDTVRLRAVDEFSDFSLTVDSKLTIIRLGTPVVFTSIENGEFALPANSLTQIDSFFSGWDEVNNLVAGATGRFVEADVELRERHGNSVRVTGAATLQAIRSRMLAEIDSVSYVRVYENRTNEYDVFNLPPHSIEAVVVGGLDQAVADKLFEVKAAGIETFGNTDIEVLDENGDVQIVNFSRSTDIYAWVKVTVNSLNAEELLPVEVEQAIIDAVLEYGGSLSIGENIITQRFYGPIYSATTGIGSITVEVAITADPEDTPSYGTANAAVARAELAVFSEDRATVVGV